MRGLIKCPQKGHDYLKSLGSEYIQELNETVNETIEDMKMKTKAKVDYLFGARKLKNVKEESERAFTPKGKTLAMKAIYQLSSLNRKNR